MTSIEIVNNPDPHHLDDLQISRWPIWTKEVSEFPWFYDEQETCYFLEGEVVVIPEGGEPITMGKGDLVTFPQGMACTWTIRKAVKKHYRMG